MTMNYADSIKPGKSQPKLTEEELRVNNSRQVLRALVTEVFEPFKAESRELLAEKPQGWVERFDDVRAEFMSEIRKKSEDDVEWKILLRNLLTKEEQNPMKPLLPGEVQKIELFVDRDSHIFVDAFILGEKQVTSVHDHVDRSCVSTSGNDLSFLETLYKVKPDGDVDITSHVRKAGTSTVVGNGREDDIHSVQNHHEQGAGNVIRIHFYDGYKIDDARTAVTSIIETTVPGKLNDAVGTRFYADKGYVRWGGIQSNLTYTPGMEVALNYAGSESHRGVQGFANRAQKQSEQNQDRGL